MEKILVVGSDPVVPLFIRRIIIRRKIAKADAIKVVDTALEVLDYLSIQSCRLLIISPDIEGISGLDLVRRLHGENIKPRILLISDRANIELAREAFILGICDLYEMPILIDSLVSTINGLLHNCHVDIGHSIYELYTKYHFPISEGRR